MILEIIKEEIGSMLVKLIAFSFIMFIISVIVYILTNFR
jgi:hypothetical protein